MSNHIKLKGENLVLAALFTVFALVVFFSNGLHMTEEVMFMLLLANIWAAGA